MNLTKVLNAIGLCVIVFIAVFVAAVITKSCENDFELGRKLRVACQQACAPHPVHYHVGHPKECLCDKSIAPPEGGVK